MVLKNLFTGQQWVKRQREQTYGHGERRAEGEIYGKSNMETYTTICKIDSQRECSVWLRKLKQLPWFAGAALCLSSDYVNCMFLLVLFHRSHTHPGNTGAMGL